MNNLPVKDLSGNTLDYAFAGGFNSVQFSEIDLNQDGTQDLFVFDRTSNKVITFINNGSTTSNPYEYDFQYESKFPSSLKDWVLLRDYNCDGKKDIFGYSSGGIQVWKNTSNTTDGVQFELITSLLLSNQNGNNINLYVSSVDIPAIDDIDGDGDLDVLTFAIAGGTLEYHMNMSIENNGNCDDIDMVLSNKCWGHFTETGIGTNQVTLNQVCTSNVPNPKSGGAHTGSTVTSLDIDGNGVKDLLLGDVSFTNVVMLLNDDIGVNANSAMVSQDVDFPSYNTPVNITLFPATFYLDINNDGKRDLIASPNVKNGAEDVSSSHLYENSGTDAIPVFNYTENNFLQGLMLEHGTNAFPAFFDYNSDNVMDLLVGNYGVYNQALSIYETKFYLYENIGNTTNPSFELIDDNYLDLPAQGIEFNAYPTFGDIDGDGDQDLIVGDYNGVLHLFTNTAFVGGVANFVKSNAEIKDNTGASIDVGLVANPFLFDLDEDNDLDLVIGERNGNFNYYENIGTSSNYNFILRTETFGNVTVTETGNIIGNSTPFLFRKPNGDIQMFSGSENGEIFHFRNINNNLDGTFYLLDNNVANIQNGKRSSIALYDLNNDGSYEALTGNLRGGLAFYSENPDFISELSVSVNSNTSIAFYPNPVQDLLRVELENISTIQIYSIEGKLVLEEVLKAGTTTLNINAPNGMYIIKVVDVNGNMHSAKMLLSKK